MRRGAVGAHRADGQDVRRVAWCRDAAHHRLAVRRLAEVAGRRDDHDAGLHRALDGLVERVVLVALGHGGAQRHVDDADVELTAVLDGPVQRLDHIGDLAGAIVAKHSQVDEVRARRHAIRARALLRGDVVARHNAGDVRAVAVAIAPAAAVGIPREVHVRDDLAGQRTMVRDAGVDDRHADATPVHAAQRRHKAVQGGVGTGGRRGQRHVRRHERVGRDLGDFGVLRQRVELAGRHLEYEAPAQALLHLQRVPREDAADRRVVAIDDDFDGRPVPRAQLAGEIGRQPGAALIAGGCGRCRQREGDEEGGQCTEGHVRVQSGGISASESREGSPPRRAASRRACEWSAGRLH